MTLDQVRQLALALPETAEAPHHEMSSFRVAGKIFATVPPGGQHLHVFVDDPLRHSTVEAQPDACEKLWWGKQVVGVQITLEAIDAVTVEELLREAWRIKAPKRLLSAAD